MAPARRNEDGTVRVQGIAVRHARDVIRNGALDAVALSDSLVLGREKVGLLLEVLKQLPENALRLAVLGLRRARQVHVLEHELPERVGGLEDLVAYGHLWFSV